MLAIAIQVIVSFGHLHRVDGFRAGDLLPLATSGLYSPLMLDAQSAVEPGDPVSKPAGLPFEYCAICVVIAMGASTVPAEAPASAPPIIASKTQFAPYTEAVASTPRDLLFQARAPPFS